MDEAGRARNAERRMRYFMKMRSYAEKMVKDTSSALDEFAQFDPSFLAVAEAQKKEATKILATLDRRIERERRTMNDAQGS